jgi:serine/threonine-protein kinase RsbW
MHTAALTFNINKALPPPQHQVRETVSKFLGNSIRLNANAEFLNLIIEEWLTNLTAHGCLEQTEHVASMMLTDLGSVIKIRLEDDCPAFDPTALPTPHLEAPLEERQVGGLGVHMIRSLVSQVRYQRVDGKNLWELERQIDTPL